MNSTQHFQIQGLHCGGCVARVQRALTPYGTQVSVTLEPPRVTIIDGQATLETLQKALLEVGEYTLTPITDTAELAINATHTPKIAIALMTMAVLVVTLLYVLTR